MGQLLPSFKGGNGTPNSSTGIWKVIIRSSDTSPSMSRAVNRTKDTCSRSRCRRIWDSRLAWGWQKIGDALLGVFPSDGVHSKFVQQKPGRANMVSHSPYGLGKNLGKAAGLFRCCATPSMPRAAVAKPSQLLAQTWSKPREALLCM